MTGKFLVGLAVLCAASGASFAAGKAAAKPTPPPPCDKPGVVSLAGEVILRIHTSAGGKDCQQRADIVQQRIIDALSIGLVYPEDVYVQFVRGEWAVFVKDILMITADKASAKINHTTPQALAKIWAANLARTIPESTPQKPGIGGTRPLETPPE